MLIKELKYIYDYLGYFLNRKKRNYISSQDFYKI